MLIKELKIAGFKSIGDISLIEPHPFSVFVGPNGAGKSNIFEAIELFQICNKRNFQEALRLFGDAEDIRNRSLSEEHSFSLNFKVLFEDINPSLSLVFTKENGAFINTSAIIELYSEYFYEELKRGKKIEAFNFIEFANYKQLVNFTRLFIKNSEILRNPIRDDSKLSLDGSNLEKVLKRLLLNNAVKAEIIELLQLLIPGLVNLEVISHELSSSDNLLIYESNLEKPLKKALISDGTYNILAIITAVYQSEEPQFLCIEEPENGLNPKVVKELVSLFRRKCKEKGHYIWLNTHSQTLVSELSPEEIILVDKVNGLTQTKQIKGMNLHGLKMDEALLTNALGGGIPW